jgi:hypothetical protein
MGTMKENSLFPRSLSITDGASPNWSRLDPSTLHPPMTFDKISGHAWSVRLAPRAGYYLTSPEPDREPICFQGPHTELTQLSWQT